MDNNCSNSKSVVHQAEAKLSSDSVHSELACSRFFEPLVDIVETADGIRVIADLPGATGENIEVELEHDTLTIEAPVHSRQRVGTTYLLREYQIGSYRRSFRLREKFDASRISATFENGVLTLTLPRAEELKPKRIAVVTH